MNRDFSLNKIYRIAMFTPIMTFRVFRKIIYQFSEDSRSIKQYKHMYKDKRCFIIGNGPSLTTKDLERLKDEVTFATNRIYSIFEETNWRPSYYLAIDNNVIRDNFKEIQKVQTQHKFINVTSKTYGISKDENTTFINMFGPYLISPYNYKTKKVCGDISKSFTLSYSVTGVAMELAIYMGFKEIYVLGVDNNYSISIDRNGVVHKNLSVKDYFGNLERKSYTIQYAEATNSYFEAFQTYADKHHIKIFNATRGGKLEVYKRINFDEFERLDNV